MTTLQVLRHEAGAARVAVAMSLPEKYAWNRSMLIAMCAVVAHETHRRRSATPRSGRTSALDYGDHSIALYRAHLKRNGLDAEWGSSN